MTKSRSNRINAPFEQRRAGLLMLSLENKTRSRWRHNWPKFDLHDRSVCFDRHAAGQTTIISDAFTSLTSVNSLGDRAFIFWRIPPGVNTHTHNIGSPTKKFLFSYLLRISQPAQFATPQLFRSCPSMCPSFTQSVCFFVRQSS